MRQALLIVDMINRFDFEGGAALLRATRPVAPRIGALARRFRAAGAPVVYVNDNFLDWRGGFADLVASCAGEGAGGAEIVRHVLPEARDRSSPATPGSSIRRWSCCCASCGCAGWWSPASPPIPAS